MLVNVVDLLRKKCKIDDEEVLVDLADEEGIVRCLPEYNFRISTKHVLKPRAVYVPFKIERDEDNIVKPYEPLVTQLKSNEEFMSTLLAQYRKRELPQQGKKEKPTGVGRSRGSNASTTNPRSSGSATKVKSKKGGTTSRAGKASR
ncbi:uncharacterized protein [Diadema antillarum]|uniref:uncharacterized protein n=1 Tax=Diadema antillarum TaxID=105358 RepID=UPI003A8A1BCC